MRKRAVNGFAEMPVEVTGTSGVGRGKAEAPPTATRPCDLSRDAPVAASLAEFIARHGRLGIMVDVAAIHHTGTLPTTETATCQRPMAVDGLLIPFAAPNVIPKMKGGEPDSKVSVQGNALRRRIAAFVATKGAIHVLALDDADAGIRADSIPPGTARSIGAEESANSKPASSLNLPIRSAGSPHRRRWRSWLPLSPRTVQFASPDRISASTAAGPQEMG